MAQLPDTVNGMPLAPSGDLSPSSRTASWSSHWPLKPDVVLEGGNWVIDEFLPPLGHESLSLLSTHRDYPNKSLEYIQDTSAATALAAKEITELWSDYPKLWPETVRGLYVSSARWTDKMREHLPDKANKGDYGVLFQRYGFGVPELGRALRSASNALAMIIEDEITPYGHSKNTGNPVDNEMKLFELPWPKQELRNLGSNLVTLRVTLSSFIAPNPSEEARGNKFRYASHNLRFKLNRADENEKQFLARISKLADDPDGPTSGEEDQWQFGRVRRDVGSLHIDQLTCKASDLAQRNLIAVHPAAGWMKQKSRLKNTLPQVRYALIIEIEADAIEAELYTEVQVAVEAMNKAGTAVVV